GEVAGLRLAAMGIDIDELTEEQAAYLSSWEHGTSVPGPDRPGPDRVAEFRAAGRTLFSLALVKGSEGNLSVFDGRTLVITRSGVSLAEIEPADLVVGALGADLPGASVDLEEHRRLYGRRGPGAIVHAHPPGTVPEGAA